MLRARYGLYWIPGIITLVGALAGTLAWFTHYITTLANTPNIVQAISPIDLAGVTATLGGLILVGAFYKERKDLATKEEKEVAIDLRTIGKIILVSSACFIATYFLLEYVQIMKSPPLSKSWFWFFIFTTDLAAIIAGVSLSVALSFLITIVRFI
jgi:hypothetical protein